MRKNTPPTRPGREKKTILPTDKFSRAGPPAPLAAAGQEKHQKKQNPTPRRGAAHVN